MKGAVAAGDSSVEIKVPENIRTWFFGSAGCGPGQKRRLSAWEWAKVKPEPHRQSIYVQPAQMSNQRKSPGEFSDTIKKGAWPELEPVPNFRYALFRDIEKESRFYFLVQRFVYIPARK